jgi:hypothetical protein
MHAQHDNYTLLHAPHDSMHAPHDNTLSHAPHAVSNERGHLTKALFVAVFVLEIGEKLIPLLLPRKLLQTQDGSTEHTRWIDCGHKMDRLRTRDGIEKVPADTR